MTSCDGHLTLSGSGQGRGGDCHSRAAASPAVQVHRASIVRVPTRPRLRAGPRLPGLRRLRRAPVLSGHSGRLLPGQVAAVQHLPGWTSAARDASFQQRSCRLPAPHFLLLRLSFVCAACVLSTMPPAENAFRRFVVY